MRKYYILSIVAIAFLTLVIIKMVHNYAKDKQQTVKAAVPAVMVECYLARDTVIEYPFKAVGYLKANERVDIVSELSRRVMTVAFKEGSMVKKGELLFQLDDSEWRAALKKNEAELELATQTQERNAKLLESGGTSRQVYEESVSRRKVLEAEAESLKVFIEKAKIRAPFAGKTGLRNVSEGAFVSPGNVLTTLEDLSSIKVDFTVPESHANTIHIGDEFNFRLEGDPKEYKARVEAIDPSVTMSTGSLRVLGRVESAGADLVPGVAVTVNMQSRSAVAGLYVPTQSLIPTPAGYKIYRVVGGKASLKPVKTGLRSDKMVEVAEGVAHGDSILVTGFMKVKPDAKVKILKTW